MRQFPEVDPLPCWSRAAHISPGGSSPPSLQFRNRLRGALAQSLEAEVLVIPWQCPASRCRDEDRVKLIMATTLITAWLKMA
ncbi:hypothetical protein Q9233_009605 [Columba guinea]|nr:hypothetical protein Q9233_009605 [Columba guinea]